MSQVDKEELIEHVKSLPIRNEEKIRVLRELAAEYGIEITEEDTRKLFE